MPVKKWSLSAAVMLPWCSPDSAASRSGNTYCVSPERKELPARVEEVHHAKEEGIQFHLLNNPVEILVDEKGWVSGVRCIRMELG